MSQDGIEIHYDAKRGYLELACEPDAFAEYRELARQHLEGIPDVQIENVTEIVVRDTATLVAKRDAPRRRLLDLLFSICIVGILLLAIIGAGSIIKQISE